MWIVVGKQKNGENNRRIGINLAEGKDNIGVENEDKIVVSNINGDMKGKIREKGKNATTEKERVVNIVRCQFVSDVSEHLLDKLNFSGKMEG